MIKSRYTISYVRIEREPADQDGPEQDYAVEKEIDFIFYSYDEALAYIENNSPKLWVDYDDFPTVSLSFDIWKDNGLSEVGEDHYEDDIELCGTITYSQPPQTNGDTNNI